jgi:hypothetical protein
MRAYGQVPTGTPRSPLFSARKFTQPLHRLEIPRPLALTRDGSGDALFPAASNELKAKRLSYHNDFNSWKAANPGQPTSANPFCNPITTPCGLSASYAAGARDCARRLRVRPLVYATAEGASVPAFARCLPGRRWRFSRRRDANH